MSPVPRFVHTADWQLGMTRHFLSGEAQSRYSEARLDAVRAIGRLAASERCAFIVVAGDVFETNQVGRSVVLPALEAMAACRVPVILVAGNHDALTAGSVYKSRTFVEHQPENVVVLETGQVLEIEGVRIVSAAWSTRKPDENPADTVLRRLEAAGRHTVLVAHGIVDGVNPQSSEVSALRIAVLESAVEDGRVDYVALGDQHSAAPVGKTGRVHYAGTPLVTSYRESNPNRALVVELSPEGAEVSEHLVGDWHFVEQRFNVNTKEDVDVVDGYLAALPERRKSVVSLSFVGTVSLATKAYLDEMLDRHREVLAALELHDRFVDMAVLADEGDFSELRLTGFAAAALDELSGCAGGATEAEAASDALALLYRLARNAR